MYTSKNIAKNKLSKENINKPNLSDLVEAANWVEGKMTDNVENDVDSKSSVTLINEDRCHDIDLDSDSENQYTIQNSILGKSTGSREHHNLLEKQRREVMRRLLKLLRDILPSKYCQERMSTSKTLQQASYFVKDCEEEEEDSRRKSSELRKERDKLVTLIKTFLKAEKHKLPEIEVKSANISTGTDESYSIGSVTDNEIDANDEFCQRTKCLIRTKN